MKTLSSSTVALLLSLFLFACQPAEETKTEEITKEAQANAIDTTAQQPRRPAPEFFIIPQEMVKSRVWLCDDGVSDIFHVKNDCSVFMSCGSTKRNVSLPRAMEEYDRYNCITCSAELSHIFDEDMIRAEY